MRRASCVFVLAFLACLVATNLFAAKQRRGIQAVVLEGWDTASVEELAEIYSAPRRAAVPKALAVCPYLGVGGNAGRYPYRQLARFLEKADPDIDVRLILHLGFHSFPEEQKKARVAFCAHFKSVYACPESAPPPGSPPSANEATCAALRTDCAKENQEDLTISEPSAGATPDPATHAPELARRFRELALALGPFLCERPDGVPATDSKCRKNLTVDVSPMLEDEWTSGQRATALTILRQLIGTATNRLSVRLSPIPESSGTGQLPADLGGRLELHSCPSFVGEEERNGCSNCRDSCPEAPSADSFSNDGAVVYISSGSQRERTYCPDGQAKCSARTVQGQLEHSSSFDGDDVSNGWQPWSLKDFRALDAPELLLWRHAYNVRVKSKKGKYPDGKAGVFPIGKVGPHGIDYSLVNKTVGPAARRTVRVMTPLEAAIVSRFLGRKPVVTANASGTAAVVLNWDVTDVEWTGTRIEKSEDGSQFVAVAALPADQTELAVDGLTPGRDYWFRILAETSDGRDPSDAVAVHLSVEPTALRQPTDLIVVGFGEETIDIAWRDNSADETGFRVALSTDGTSYDDVGSAPPDVTHLRVEHLRPNTRYWLKLRATRGDEYSVYSDVVEIETKLEPPAAPTDLRAANVWARALDLAWKDNSDNETGFRIARSTDGVHYDNVGITSPDDVRFRVENLRPNTRYWFKVRSARAGEYSGYTNVLEVRTKIGS